MISLQAYIDGSWSDLVIDDMGATDDRLYVEVSLDSPIPVLTQKMTRTPTAVTLSSLGIVSPFGSAHPYAGFLSAWVGLMIMTLLTLAKRSRASKQ